MIRQATRADLDAVAASYDELLRHEAEHGGYTNWRAGVYPVRATAESALKAGALYVLEEDGAVAASVILNRDQAAEYAQIPWRYPAAPDEVLVAHTLCVRPACAGRGLGRQLVSFIKTHARRLGCRAIRLDTWAGNHPAAALYASEGFRFAGKARSLHQGLIDEELIYLECDPARERFDPSPSAVLNPWDLCPPLEDCPKTVVTCFAANLVDYARQRWNGEIVAELGCANGSIPLYKIHVNGTALGLTMTLVGAAPAVSQYEELFAMGVERILTFGTCGVLDRSVDDCAILIPSRAVRDEGTSFHYAPPSEEIAANANTLNLLATYFNRRNIRSTVCKVWTSDAPYRETRAAVARRRAQGCLAVEMECAALAALAQFRQKSIAQFLYAADNLDSDLWDMRSLSNAASLDAKQAIVELAVGFGAEWERGEERGDWRGRTSF